MYSVPQGTKINNLEETHTHHIWNIRTASSSNIFCHMYLLNVNNNKQVSSLKDIENPILSIGHWKSHFKYYLYTIWINLWKVTYQFLSKAFLHFYSPAEFTHALNCFQGLRQDFINVSALSPSSTLVWKPVRYNCYLIFIDPTCTGSSAQFWSYTESLSLDPCAFRLYNPVLVL